MLDVVGPLQVFASANSAAIDADGDSLYALRVVAARSPLVSSAGLEIVTQPLTRARDSVHSLIVAGGRGVHAASMEPLFVRWIKRRAACAERVISICTGAFLLGAAGLLDGKRAVTHWADCARLVRNFPRARVESTPIFVRDGKIWTSGGVTAGIDLALALVEADAGHAIAMTVARELVVYLRRPGNQAQFSTYLELQASDREWTRLHTWIAEHLTYDLTNELLASQLGMSERTLIRRYRAATGLTPARAVERIRVEAVSILLTTTRHSIKRIAARCGYVSEETLRRNFTRHFGVTPQEYRARFSATR
jgi:transcriptional regulator GlxA family with amidase domain